MRTSVFKQSEFLYRVEQSLEDINIKNKIITDVYFYHVDKKLISENINCHSGTSFEMKDDDYIWLQEFIKKYGVINDN